jgi:hypothetical protein
MVRSEWVYAADGGGRFVEVAGGKWSQASNAQPTTSIFMESGRTDEYVELRGVNVNVVIRLFDDHFDASFDGGTTWKQEYNGAWVDPNISQPSILDRRRR